MTFSQFHLQQLQEKRESQEACGQEPSGPPGLQDDVVVVGRPNPGQQDVMIYETTDSVQPPRPRQDGPLPVTALEMFDQQRQNTAASTEGDYGPLAEQPGNEDGQFDPRRWQQSLQNPIVMQDQMM